MVVRRCARFGTVGAVTQDQIDDAVAEAERPRSVSDRDLSASVQHFGAAVRAVCQEWGLTVERWLPGGAGTPPLVVRRADGSAAVLKFAEPGAMDRAVGVMRADDGLAYAEVLAWKADRGAAPGAARLRSVGRGGHPAQPGPGARAVASGGLASAIDLWTALSEQGIGPVGHPGRPRAALRVPPSGRARGRAETRGSPTRSQATESVDREETRPTL